MNNKGTQRSIIGKTFLWCVGFMLLGQIANAQIAMREPVQLQPKQPLISVDFQQTPLPKALQAITQKVDVGLSYKTAVVPSNLITYRAENQPVYSVLDRVLQGTDLYYELSKNQKVILIKQRHLQVIPPVQEMVSGNVTNAETGEPISNVNIVVRGTNTGTTTNAEGHYSLQVPSLQDTLAFSFVGYESEVVSIGGRTEINVQLEPTTIVAEELVVVGYGTQEKKNITGAMTTISAEEIADKDYLSVSKALQGAAPGLMVRRNSGDPGTGASIRIRGITTLGNSSPLIIVNGIPMSDIDDINPSNIASISVLKDAASAAIYGSRAAAGVILITTKSGKKGELNVEAGFEYGIVTPTEIPGYVGPVTYMRMANESRWNEAGNPPEGKYPLYDKEVVANYYELNKKNPDKYPIVDNQELMIKDFAPKQRYYLNLSGGSENIRFRGSLSFTNVDGLFMHRNYKNINVRLSNSMTLIDGLLNAKIDLYFNRDIQKRPFLGNPVYWARKTAPIYAVRYTNGKLASGKTGDNYYGKLLKGGWRHHYANKLRGRLELNIRPLSGLELTARFGPELHFGKRKNFQKQVPYYTPGADPKKAGYLKSFEYTNLFLDRTNNYKYTIQFLVSYKKDFNRHSLDIMAGYEAYRNFTENIGASRKRFKLKRFPYLSMGPLEFRDNYGNASGNAYRSYFGRVTYDYNDKYLLQGTIRFDGSSRFAPNYRWGVFPSVSVGWVLTEEPFMEESDPLSYFKVRASYGTLGNERIGLYPYQSVMSFNNALLYQSSDLKSVLTAAQIQWNIVDITWETTTVYNIGVDIHFLDNKLQFTGDYYRKYTKDMLLNLEIPDYLGFNNPDQNAGKMITKGWGIQLSWNDSFGKIRYSISANLSDYKSTMGDLSGTVFKGSKITAEGTLYRAWYGYKSDGLYQTQQEVKNSAVTSKTVGPGDINYIDISGPQGKPDGQISPAYDRVPLGGSLPRYLYGGQLKIGYKNFSFSLQIQGVGKKIDRLTKMMVEPLNTYWQNIPKLIVDNYWSYYNSDKENRNAEYPKLSEVAKSHNYAMSDYWLFDGSYLRIKNIHLGYNLPKTITNKFSVDKFKVYLNITDLYSFNNYPKGWDPEVAVSGYPITTNIVIGAEIQF